MTVATPRFAGPGHRSTWTDYNAIINYLTHGLVFDVMAPDFGAKGDGLTDDTAAVNAARTAAIAAGGTVLFRPGFTFAIDQFQGAANLTVLARGATILHNGSNKPLLSIHPDTLPTDPALQYFRWLGGTLTAKQSATNPTTALVYLTSAWNCEILPEKLQAGNADGSTKYAQYGYWLFGRLNQGVYYNRLGGQVSGAAVSPLFIDGWTALDAMNRCNANYADDLRLNTNAAGVRCNGGQGWLFSRGDLENNAGPAYRAGMHTRQMWFLMPWTENSGPLSTDPQLDVPTSRTLTTLSFTAATKRISDSANGLSDIQVGNALIVTGSASNNGYFTVATGGLASGGAFIVVNETVVGEAAGATVTIQSSPPITASRTRTTLSFVAATKRVNDSGNELIDILTGDTVVVTGTVSNNGTYTVADGGHAGYFVTNKALVNEAAGASMTLTLGSIPMAKTLSTISFVAPNRINDSGNHLHEILTFTTIIVTGSVANDGIYTVADGEHDDHLLVNEVIVNGAAGPLVTIKAVYEQQSTRDSTLDCTLPATPAITTIEYFRRLAFSDTSWENGTVTFTNGPRFDRSRVLETNLQGGVLGEAYKRFVIATNSDGAECDVGPGNGQVDLTVWRRIAAHRGGPGAADSWEMGASDGSTGGMVVGGGTLIKRMLKGTATWNPGNLADGASATKAVTVTGAAIGDGVEAPGFPLLIAGVAASAGWQISGQVTAADTVTVTLTNHTGGAQDLDSGTLQVWVRKS